MLAQSAEIEVVVAILAALHDETVAVPRQELDWVARLYILLVGLAIEFAGLLAGLCAVGSEACAKSRLSSDICLVQAWRSRSLSQDD